jgi:SMP-30/Gluconolactonase/LRE-like region/FAD binding domain
MVDGGYVVSAGSGFLFLDGSARVVELAQPEAGRGHVRMNDGACDPQGRFWAGTMAHDETPGEGMLYRLELDGTCTRVLTGLTISNGIGWSTDGTAMYLSDSGTATIDVLEFDPVSGDIGARRTIVRIAEQGVAPDGITVDGDGNVWGRAAGRRRGALLQPRRSAPANDPGARRSRDVVRVRPAGRRDAVHHHRPSRARRGGTGAPAGRRARVPRRRARRQCPTLRPVPRQHDSAGSLFREPAVLGGGPAGMTAALHARELGAEVTLIEAKHMGGTSVNLWASRGAHARPRRPPHVPGSLGSGRGRTACARRSTSRPRSRAPGGSPTTCMISIGWETRFAAVGSS